MNIITTPDTLEKLHLLENATEHEPAGTDPQTERAARPARQLPPCVSMVSTPTGPKPIMKAMLTTACERNCNYCVFRAGRGKTRRLSFKPDEMAAGFDQIQRAKAADGMFLSSGIIKGSIATQDRIIDTAEIIRKKYRYRGYVHLKLMPGAEYDQIYRAMQLADRVSINLEGPTHDRLSLLAPKKNFTEELLQRILWASQIRKKDTRIRSSIVTQFVVGAVGDTDVELLSLSDKLYNQAGLARTYFCAFNPVTDTPFENLQPTVPTRELRLYQSSFLLRDYGWNVEELSFEGNGNLRLDIDPKRAWAEANLLHSPIEIMKANRAELLRIPNIGPKAADKIIRARRTGRITELSHLRALGIAAPEQAVPFITLDGHSPSFQMKLF